MILSNYENEQIDEIKTWKREEPSVAMATVGFVLTPVTWLIEKIVPDAAIRGVLDFSSYAAEWLTDTKDIVRDAGVKDVMALKRHDLEKSDQLANEVHNWAIGLASVEGGAAGAFGIGGMAFDIPSIIVIALRTIHKIGVCYGFEVKTKSDKNFVLAILAASGANDMAEKVAALGTLRKIEVMVAKQTWKKLAEASTKERLGKEAGIIGLKTLAKQLGINLTKRKASQAIPVFGALVGASVNGWYVKEVGWAARRAFQERWLIENHKVIDV